MDQALPRIRAYWNRFLHDQQMSAAPPGAPDWFAALADYRYSKQPYLEQLAGFESYGGKRLLEIGCGIGLDLARFARGGARVIGVDVAERAVHLAGQHLRRQGVTGDVLVMNAEELAFAADTFDVVYGHGVLPYVANPAAIAAEIHRVLRVGGVAVLMVYHTDSWLKWTSRVTRVDLEHARAPVFRTFTRSDVHALLRRFRRVRIVPERYPVPTRLHRGWKALLYNRAFVPAFEALPRAVTRRWGWHLMIWAEK